MRRLIGLNERRNGYSIIKDGNDSEKNARVSQSGSIRALEVGNSAAKCVEYVLLGIHGEFGKAIRLCRLDGKREDSADVKGRCR